MIKNIFSKGSIAPFLFYGIPNLLIILYILYGGELFVDRKLVDINLDLNNLLQVTILFAISFIFILLITDYGDNLLKNNNKFLEGKELNEILKEKGINTNRSQFYCDNLNINLDKK